MVLDWTNVHSLKRSTGFLPLQSFIGVDIPLFVLLLDRFSSFSHTSCYTQDVGLLMSKDKGSVSIVILLTV